MKGAHLEARPLDDALLGVHAIAALGLIVEELLQRAEDGVESGAVALVAGQPPLSHHDGGGRRLVLEECALTEEAAALERGDGGARLGHGGLARLDDVEGVVVRALLDDLLALVEVDLDQLREQQLLREGKG